MSARQIPGLTLPRLCARVSRLAERQAGRGFCWFSSLDSHPRSRNHERDDRPDSSGLDQRFRQGGPDRAGASSGRERHARSSPAAAPERPRRMPVSMSPKSPTTPASPKSSAAASRPCTPRSTAESSPAVTNPTTSRRSSGQGSCRSTWSSSTSIRSRRRRRATRRNLGRGDRKHRHRRANAHPRRRQEPRARRRPDQPRAVRDRDRGPERRGRDHPGRSTPARARGLPRDRRVRPGDHRLLRASRGTAGGPEDYRRRGRPDLRPQTRPAPAVAIRRESAPDRPRFTSSRSRRGPTWRPRSCGTARSSPTTTCSTWTVPCGWSASSRNRPRASSSTTTPAVPRSPPRRPRRSNVPTKEIQSAPSEASWV